jgi:hypothetical protein
MDAFRFQNVKVKHRRSSHKKAANGLGTDAPGWQKISPCSNARAAVQVPQC